MSRGKNKAVTIWPSRVDRIVAEEVSVKGGADFRRAKGESEVT
jgi:hypothetical protein